MSQDICDSASHGGAKSAPPSGPPGCASAGVTVVEYFPHRATWGFALLGATRCESAVGLRLVPLGTAP